MMVESALAFALLGLLLHEPRSGYDLRKVFASTPMGIFSDSPGAIYPALRRLAARGWIQPVTSSPGGRRRQTFEPSEAGRAALLDWLSAPPPLDDVARRWDELMLRLAMMSGVVPVATVKAFLDQIAAALDAYSASLEAFQSTTGKALPLLAQLAFASGVDGIRAQQRWVREARRRVVNGRER